MGICYGQLHLVKVLYTLFSDYVCVLKIKEGDINSLNLLVLSVRDFTQICSYPLTAHFFIYISKTRACRCKLFVLIFDRKLYGFMSSIWY